MITPTLSPGDIVILEDLTSHKVKGVRQAIGWRDAKLLNLLPYSPHSNPIEHLSAQSRALFRKATYLCIDIRHDDQCAGLGSVVA